jgi:hypothetical protein
VCLGAVDPTSSPEKWMPVHHRVRGSRAAKTHPALLMCAWARLTPQAPPKRWMPAPHPVMGSRAVRRALLRLMDCLCCLLLLVWGPVQLLLLPQR